MVKGTKMSWLGLSHHHGPSDRHTGFTGSGGFKNMKSKIQSSEVQRGEVTWSELQLISNRVDIQI